MRPDWRVATFQQLLNEGSLEIGDGYRAQNNELGGSGPIFLRAGHVTDTHINFAGAEHFHDHLAPKVRSKMSKVGDTVITTKGNSTGRTSFVSDRLPPFVYSPHLSYWRSRDPDKLCGGFLRYWSRSVEFIDQLSGMKASTDMAPYLSLTDQRRLSITLPPIGEQKTIAAVLGALDDKIELNRRMNATLEAMARALFQSWFVDFDPVRAKLDGREPVGLAQATAAHFPDSFQDSGAGQIPKGWEVKTLSDLASLITKGTTPTQEDIDCAPDSDTHVNYVRVNAIDDDGSILADKMTKIPESVHARVLKRSVLIANDVLYTIAGTIGRIALAEAWMLPANTNQAVAIIRPESEIPPGFLILTMRHEVFREELHNNIVHAVQANLSLGMLSKARIVVPPKAMLQRLFKPIDALLSQIRANRAQSRTLATLRDTLLPNLLSGELSA